MTEQGKLPVVDADVEEGVPDITLSTGVVLRLQVIPPGVYIRVSTRDKMPQPPRYAVKHKPDVILAHTDDENYIKEVKQWDTEQSNRILFAMVLYGIEEIVSVPKGVEKHTGNKWIDRMRYTDADVFPDDPQWRRASWVLEVAAVTAEDFSMLQTGVGRLSGVAEEDVQQAGRFPERKKGS